MRILHIKYLIVTKRTRLCEKLLKNYKKYKNVLVLNSFEFPAFNV
jgi:hypothetical protein